MEFGDDDDHEEEEQEDEGDQEDEDDDDEDDEGITIPPPPSTQQPTQTQVEASPSNHNQEQLASRKPGFTSSSSISTPSSSTTTTTTYRYRECLKNHAVSMGGHAVDGCGEFMPAGEEGTLESFKCAACGCHRNFHRKESDISSTPPPPPPLYPHHQFSSSPFNYRTPLPPQPSPFQVVAPPPPPSQTHHHNYRPGRLALPSSGRIDHYQLHNREMDEFSNPSSSGGGGGGTRRVISGSGSGSGKSKRFRTKFTPEQKERMLEFAERVGWRLQKHDEIAVQQFCQDVGVRRQVLKVWMHNNKNTLGGSSRRSTTV